MIHEDQPVRTSGKSLSDAEIAVIMIHGRGATPGSVLRLAENFEIEGVAYLAPEAANNEWYPESFLNPVEQNQPEISSALDKVRHVKDEIEENGIPAEKIVLLGFSQGACLATEYAVRNPERYGGVIAFSGGLIGKEIPEHEGDLEGTPVFIGCSDRDPHIPLERVNETAEVFERLNADVDKRIYEGMGHKINEEELNHAAQLISDLEQGWMGRGHSS